MLESFTAASSGLLTSLIRASGLEVRQVQARLGPKIGDLEAALDGQADLTLRQLLSVLSHLGVEPLTYFEALFPRPVDLRDGAHLTARLRERIAESHLEPRGAEDPPFAPAELDARIRDAVREATRAVSDNSR